MEGGGEGRIGEEEGRGGEGRGGEGEREQVKAIIRYLSSSPLATIYTIGLEQGKGKEKGREWWREREGEGRGKNQGEEGNRGKKMRERGVRRVVRG